MSSTAERLVAFFNAWRDLALVEIVEAKGSTPRDKGAWMLVSREAIFGTIGGGQLEFMAIERAREMLGEGAGAEQGRDVAKVDDGRSGVVLDLPLGPEIGQCCGGRVEIAIGRVDAQMRNSLLAAAEAEDTRRPHVYLFGGGHVGHALAAALALLPMRTILVETRAEALGDIPAAVETRLTPVPEEAIRAAPAGSAYLILTHDHALDFLLVAEALGRADAAYVGMIGSRTKKATFRNWYLRSAGGSEAALARLVTPIGGHGVDDKRPAVIAALAAAEVMRALAGR